MADAAYTIFCQPSRSFTGTFAIDEALLAAQGIRDLSQYSCDPHVPQAELSIDLFVDGETIQEVPPMKSVLLIPPKPKL